MLANNKQIRKPTPDLIVLDDDYDEPIAKRTKYDNNETKATTEAAEVKNNDKNIEEFIDNWKTRNIDELLLTNDFLYNDPEVKKLRPHESYVYTLGLSLALEYAIESTLRQKEYEKRDKTNNQQQQSSSSGSLVDSELNFVKNFKNKTSLNELKLVTKSFQFKQHRCKLCNYTSESNMIIDNHLTEPHNYNLTTKPCSYFICNYCNIRMRQHKQSHETVFRTSNKDEYSSHLIIKHNRYYMPIKPLAIHMCNICDFECKDKFRYLKHQQICAFNKEYLDKIENKIQQPTLADYLDYDFLFDSNYTQSSLAQHSQLHIIPKQQQQQQSVINIPNSHNLHSKSSSMNIPNFANNTKIDNLKGAKISQILLNNNTNNNCKQKNVYVFPKFLVCPICNGLLRNLLDLTSHLKNTHSLDEKYTNKLISDKVIPQLYKNSNVTQTSSSPSSSSSSKTSNNQSPSTLMKSLPLNSTLSSTVSLQTVPMTSKTNSHTNNRLDYVTELTLINNFLKSIQQNTSENKFNDVKTLAGKCFLCNGKTFYDLLVHMKQEHTLTVSSQQFYLNCLLCGHKALNRELLIKHQYMEHKIVVFTSLNKVYTIGENMQFINDQFNPKKNGLNFTSTPKKKNGKVYKCNDCGKEFEEFSIYCSHLINEHKQSSSKKALTTTILAPTPSSSSDTPSLPQSLPSPLPLLLPLPLPPMSASTPVPPTSASTPVLPTSASTPVPPTSVSTSVPPALAPKPVPTLTPSEQSTFTLTISKSKKTVKINPKIQCPICKKTIDKGEAYQTHIKTHVKECKIEIYKLPYKYDGNNNNNNNNDTNNNDNNNKRRSSKRKVVITKSLFNPSKLNTNNSSTKKKVDLIVLDD